MFDHPCARSTYLVLENGTFVEVYWGTDKSLAQPGRKQVTATKL